MGTKRTTRNTRDIAKSLTHAAKATLPSVTPDNIHLFPAQDHARELGVLLQKIHPTPEALSLKQRQENCVSELSQIIRENITDFEAAFFQQLSKLTDTDYEGPISICLPFTAEELGISAIGEGFLSLHGGLIKIYPIESLVVEIEERSFPHPYSSSFSSWYPELADIPDEMFKEASLCHMTSRRTMMRDNKKSNPERFIIGCELEGSNGEMIPGFVTAKPFLTQARDASQNRGSVMGLELSQTKTSQLYHGITALRTARRMLKVLDSQVSAKQKLEYTGNACEALAPTLCELSLKQTGLFGWMKQWWSNFMARINHTYNKYSLPCVISDTLTKHGAIAEDDSTSSRVSFQSHSQL